MKFCQTCGKAVEDDNIVCPDPKCHGPLRSTPPVKGISPEDLDAITKHVWSQLWKKHIYFITGEFSILMLIGLFGLVAVYHQATNEVKQLIVAKIDAEFKTERIRQTVSDVAANQAKELMLSQIQPEVQKFEAQVSTQLGEVTTMTTNAASAVSRVDEQAAFLSVLTAALCGKRSAYDDLTKIALDKNSPFQTSAERATSAAVIMYSPNPLASKFPINWREGVDPKTVTLERIENEFDAAPPDMQDGLVNFVWYHQDWPIRDKMNLLLKVITTGKDLKSVLTAASLFSQQAGWDSYPTRNFYLYDQWWATNKNTPKFSK
jgi:hypothetical protein